MRVLGKQLARGWAWFDTGVGVVCEGVGKYQVVGMCSEKKRNVSRKELA